MWILKKKKIFPGDFSRAIGIESHGYDSEPFHLTEGETDPREMNCLAQANHHDKYKKQ